MIIACLLIQRSQIGGAGDVAADSAVEVVNTQCHAVLGNRGAQNGDGVGGGCAACRAGVALAMIRSTPRKQSR